MPEPECIATGDPDLHECNCPDCRDYRDEQDERDREMYGDDEYTPGG